MRTAEKIQRNRRCERAQNQARLGSAEPRGGAPKAKQESTNLPFSIGLILKTVVVVAGTVTGFCVWGAEFVWVVLGLVFCLRILKAIASCLVSLICLIGFFWFIFTHIF